MRSLRFGELAELASSGGRLDDLALDYGTSAGLPALREIVGMNCGVDPESVVTVPGTMLGLHLLASSTRGDGGEALLVTPCFGPMRAALKGAGMPVRSARPRFEEGYQPDAAPLAAMLRPQTKLVCLADPNNPSGVRTWPHVLQALLAEMRCRARLFLDETYREATHGGGPLPSGARLDSRAVVAGSLCKAHGAPGLRIGRLTIRDAAMRERIIAAKEMLILCGSVLDETLAAALLRRPEALLDARREALGEALGAVLRWRDTVVGTVEMVRPDAGALCCMRLRPGTVPQAGVKRFWSAIRRERLRLAPGPWFGETWRLFRLGFGHLPPSHLAPALHALSRALDAAA